MKSLKIGNPLLSHFRSLRPPMRSRSHYVKQGLAYVIRGTFAWNWDALEDLSDGDLHKIITRLKNYESAKKGK